MSGLRAVLVTPLTGSLGGFGTAGAHALRLWASSAGAILDVHDAHPDPAAAVRAAESARPDLLFGPYGSGPSVAVAGATERLLWNHGGARLAPSPRVVNVLAPVSTYWDGALHLLAPHVRTLVVRHGPTGFGQTVGEGAAATGWALGLVVTVEDLDGTTEGDLLLVAGGFAEEQAVAAAALPGRWRAAGFVGAGVEEVLPASVREGLFGPAQWLPAAAPQPDEGPTAAEFVAAYRDVTGTEPPYPAAQAFAAGLLAARCVREAGGTADDDVRAAAVALDTTTMFGRFRLDPATGEQIGHRIVTVQWQRGVRRVVWPTDVANSTPRVPPPAP